jgi:GTP-binding protein LepA
MKIRNFAILSHIDHGKSTLADRLLEITGTISAKNMRPQFLDSMDLEREKGITIKLKPVRMGYKDPTSGEEYILNLIDTPGHVDFSYEVSRALAAVEGIILLVDATQGVQAQTLANLDFARKQNVVIIPAVNKIDMPQAMVEETVLEISAVLGVDPSEVLRISAKQGTNIDSLLKRIIERVPPPQIGQTTNPFRALIFDSDYDSYKGVLAFIRVTDGEIFPGVKIRLFASKAPAEVRELGFFNPELSIQKKLSAGDVGYIATGIKEPGKVRAGDTIVLQSQTETKPLAGYMEPEPMVFASFYPSDPDDFDLLKDALSKLKLNDPALVYEPESKDALGRGFKCGFLGTLHVEIVSERLSREFGLKLVISTPSVVYKITDKKGQEDFIYSATDWPEVSSIEKIEEPWYLLEVITPVSSVGKVMEVMEGAKGVYRETKYISSERAIVEYEIPLRKIVANLYDKIKSATQGYASMNYKLIGFRQGDLVKLEIFIAGRKEEALSRIVPRDEAYQEGKNLVEKLKNTLPPAQFSIALQAVSESRVIARETITARRKDVTGYLYGGDYSRKRKLLEKQKKGKKLLKEKGRIDVPQNVFLEIFRS